MNNKRILAGVIAILGLLCVVCGALLLRGSPPSEQDPVPSASPTTVPTAEPTQEPESSQQEEVKEPYVSPIDFNALQEGIFTPGCKSREQSLTSP